MSRSASRSLRRNLPALSLAGYLLYPLCRLVGGWFGWQYALYSPALYSAALLALALAAVLRAGPPASRLDRWIRALTFPASLVFWVCLTLYGLSGLLAPLFSLMASFCAAALLARGGRTTARKIWRGVLSGIPLLAACLLYLAMCLFRLFPFGEVIRRVYPSPGGEYLAEVIVTDEGALGGSARVEVRPRANARFGLLLGEFRRFPDTAFWGDWIDPAEAEVAWLDDEHFLFAGTRYAARFDPDVDGVVDVCTVSAHAESENGPAEFYAIGSGGQIKEIDGFRPDEMETFRVKVDGWRDKRIEELQTQTESGWKPIAVPADMEPILSEIKAIESMLFEVRVFRVGGEYFVYAQENANFWLPCSLYSFDPASSRLVLLYTFDDRLVTGLRVRSSQLLRQLAEGLR